MRKLVTKQEAEDLLKPYKAILAEVIRSALLDWNKLLAEAPQLTGGLRGRTRASYIHERIVYRLQAVISQHPGLRLLRVRGGLAVVVVRDQLALKLKKLGRSGYERYGRIRAGLLGCVACALGRGLLER